KTVVVIKHAVDDAAFFAGRGGFDHEFAAARGDCVELVAALARIEVGSYRTRQQESSRLELIVERADESTKLRHRIGELQLLEKPARMPCQRAMMSGRD